MRTFMTITRAIMIIISHKRWYFNSFFYDRKKEAVAAHHFSWTPHLLKPFSPSSSLILSCHKFLKTRKKVLNLLSHHSVNHDTEKRGGMLLFRDPPYPPLQNIPFHSSLITSNNKKEISQEARENKENVNNHLLVFTHIKSHHVMRRHDTKGWKGPKERMMMLWHKEKRVEWWLVPFRYSSPPISTRMIYIHLSFWNPFHGNLCTDHSLSYSSIQKKWHKKMMTVIIIQRIMRRQ